jgi:hypothetical protein
MIKLTDDMTLNEAIDFCKEVNGWFEGIGNGTVQIVWRAE